MSGSPDMNHLGEAVHAFLALDRAAHALEARKIRAAETLERWGITAIAPDELLTMSDRISAHLGSNYPGMTIRVEVPVFAKRGGQRLYGRIDLLLTDDDKAIVIDHKSYPGAYETWEEKAIGYLLIRDTPSVGMYVLNMFRMRGSRLWGSRLHRACAV